MSAVPNGREKNRFAGRDNPDDPRVLEKRLRTVIEESPLGVHVFTPEGRSLLSNRVWDELWHLEENPRRKNIFEDEQVRAAGLLSYVEESRDGRAVETPPLFFDPATVGRKGKARWLRALAYPVNDDCGNLREIALLLEDVTERKEAEEALSASRERLKSVIAGAPVILCTTDEAGVINFIDGRGLDSLGVGAREFLGRSLFDLLPEPGGAESVRKVLAGEEVTTEGEYGGLTFEYRTSPIKNENGEPAGCICVALDITERKELEGRLSHQALHDALTGLANRTLLLDRLGHALTRARRRGGRVALLYVDLDNFKYVNDSLGHGAGDGLLVEVAGRFKECVRPEDTVARLGGDEFVVLLEEVEGVAEAERAARRISLKLEEPFPAEDREVFVTASVGIVVGRAAEGFEKKRAGELLRDADLAMYSKKESGKDGYAVFRPAMGRRSRERLALEGDLRRALERGEFAVHYQPKVRIGTQEVAGFEALVRWNHPERGLLAPGDFIALAEETGLISRIGRHVLEEACARAKEWQEAYPAEPPLSLNVNVSARQIRAREFVEEVEEALRESGLDAGSLTLEITESTAMEDTPATVAVLRSLRRLGVRIAIDDFGTGYSSLSYLKRLPVDTIKVDRSIVSGLDRDAGNFAIILSVVTLARSLGLAVVAEGVETAGENEKVRALGCDEGQGYYWHKPLRAEETWKVLGRKSG